MSSVIILNQRHGEDFMGASRLAKIMWPSSELNAYSLQVIYASEYQYYICNLYFLL